MPPLTWASLPVVAVRLKPSDTAKVCMITTMPITPISMPIMISISVKPAGRAQWRRVGFIRGSARG